MNFTKLSLAVLLTVNIANAKTVLRLNEWPGYVSMQKNEIIAYAKSKGMDIDFEIIKPDISDENSTFDNLRSGKVDILTPTESFIQSRSGKILKLLAPVDSSKVAGYSAIPDSLRSSKFHQDKSNAYGVVFMAGYYGLYYNTKKVKEAPKSWDVLWSDAAKAKYSVSKDTYFVNAHIAQWVLDPKNPTNAYDASKMDPVALKAKLSTLAKNAKHLWTGIGNTPAQLNELDYTASWGFDVNDDWKLAIPAPGSPMWVDVLSISAEAAKDENKLKAYYLIAEFLVSKNAQKVFKEKLRAIPLVAESPVDLNLFNADFFWRPLDERTSNLLLNTWNEAQK